MNLVCGPSFAILFLLSSLAVTSVHASGNVSFSKSVGPRVAPEPFSFSFHVFHVGPDDRRHIAYSDSGHSLVAYTEQNGVWERETVFSGLGMYDYVRSPIGIDTDDLGAPGISWVLSEDQNNYVTLMHSVRVDTGWTTEVVDSSICATEPSLGFDEFGAPHVAFLSKSSNSNGDCYGGIEPWNLVRYATKSGGMWSVEVVDSSDQFGTPQPVIAMEAGSIPHILYSVPDGVESGRTVRHAVRTGETWFIEDVETGVDALEVYGLQVDGEGRVHALYGGSIEDFTAHCYLWYARRDSSGWQLETIVQGGNFFPDTAAMVLDGQGRPHISYGESLSLLGELWYTTRLGGHWQSWPIEIGFGLTRSYSNPISIDSMGIPQVSYIYTHQYASFQQSIVGSFMVASRQGWTTSKVSDTCGEFLGAVDDEDRLGGAGVSLGDINGDGVEDVAVGAYQDDDGGMDYGAVWILLMRADHTVKEYQKISAAPGGGMTGLGAFNHFGRALEVIGDHDGDGVADLAVGGPRHGASGTNAGAVWILFLNSDGTLKSFQKVIPGSVGSGAEFGESIASLGDLDGDGVTDIAVGALDSDGGGERGSVYICFLNMDGTLKSYQKISSTQGGFPGVLEDGNLFGSALAALDDVNGDGITDLAVGAMFDDDGASDAGAVWIVQLNTNGTAKAATKISSGVGGLSISTPSFNLGRSIEAIGDRDGDGTVDIMVGAANENALGHVYTMYLGPGGTLQDFTVMTGDSLQDSYGRSLGMGNFDLDPEPEILIGAMRDDDGGMNRGAFYIDELPHVPGTPTDISEPDVPAHPWMLSQNYPNPFNPTTTIRYQIQTAGEMSLNIYNVRGALVRRLDSGHRVPGVYDVDWNGENDHGRGVASGIYFYRLSTREFSQTRKMVLLK